MCLCGDWGAESRDRGEPAGAFEDGARGTSDRRGDLCRQRGQGGAVYHGLQSGAVAAGFFPGCAGVHGGTGRRAERDHSQRGEAGERGEQLDGAKDHGDRRGIIWGGELRAVREGV